MPDQPVTLRAVAAAAHVHPSTASRALSPKTRTRLNPETVRAVQEAADQLGYRPDHVARMLRSGRTGTIGVLLPDTLTPTFGAVVWGLEERLTQHGYVSLYGNARHDPACEREMYSTMLERRVDGLVLVSPRSWSLTRAERDIQSSQPVIQIGQGLPDSPITWLSADNEQGARDAVRHLVRLGHRRIACIAGPQDMVASQARLRGYREGLRESGIEADEDLVVVTRRLTSEEGLRACQELLARGCRFTAIATADDAMAIACVRTLLDAGLQVPGDVSVIGFDDMQLADMYNPSLSTVRFPQHEIGVQGADLMLDQLDGERSVRHIIVQTKVISRESTAPPASPSSVPGERELTSA